MHDVRGRGRRGVVGKQPDLQPADDWLGDVSDEDWSEEAATFAERRRVTQVPQEQSYDALSPSDALPAAATDTHRTTVERRRAFAALVLLVLIGLAGAAAVLLLRDGADAPATTAESTTVSTPTETDPVQTTPSTTPTETTPTEPTENATTFTLPEGTKLQRGEGVGESDLIVSTDPELIADLQRALTTAGYDPGTVDGDFGLNTEAAVVAFQQANGLSPDGIVGPETAEALNSAIAGG